MTMSNVHKLRGILSNLRQALSAKGTSTWLAVSVRASADALEGVIASEAPAIPASADQEALRKQYVDTRSQLDVVQNHLNNACGKLSKAISDYAHAAERFLPASAAALCLELPPLPDDFELLSISELPASIESDEVEHYLVLCPTEHRWRQPRNGEHNIVVARRKKTPEEVHEALLLWANKNKSLTEFHRILKAGTDVRLRHMGGDAWRVICDGSHELPLCISGTPRLSGATPTLRACYSRGLSLWRLA